MKKLFLIALLMVVFTACVFNATVSTSFDKKDKEGEMHKVTIIATVQSKTDVEVSVIIDENIFSCGVIYGEKENIENSLKLTNWEDFKITGEVEAEINGVKIVCKAKKT